MHSKAPSSSHNADEPSDLEQVLSKFKDEVNQRLKRIEAKIPVLDRLVERAKGIIDMGDDSDPGKKGKKKDLEARLMDKITKAVDSQETIIFKLVKDVEELDRTF